MEILRSPVIGIALRLRFGFVAAVSGRFSEDGIPLKVIKGGVRGTVAIVFTRLIGAPECHLESTGLLRGWNPTPLSIPDDFTDIRTGWIEAQQARPT